MAAPARRQVAQRAPHGHQREQRQRQVDPEDPAPRQEVRQVAADHRAGHAGHGPHPADITLVAAALAQRHHVGNGRLRHRQQPAAAEALQDAREDQLRHRLRQRAGGGSQQEQHDGEGQHRPPAEQIGQLAVDRRGDGRCHQVGGDHPRHVVEAIELQRDLGQHHGNDRLLQRAQQDRQHQPEDHLHDRHRGHGRAGIVPGGGRGRGARGAGGSGSGSGSGSGRVRGRLGGDGGHVHLRTAGSRQASL
ncbi:hypothetical protein D3C81_1392450 [compost metagenome]